MDGICDNCTADQYQGRIKEAEGGASSGGILKGVVIFECNFVRNINLGLTKTATLQFSSKEKITSQNFQFVKKCLHFL